MVSYSTNPRSTCRDTVFHSILRNQKPFSINKDVYENLPYLYKVEIDRLVKEGIAVIREEKT